MSCCKIKAFVCEAKSYGGTAMTNAPWMYWWRRFSLSSALRRQTCAASGMNALRKTTAFRKGQIINFGRNHRAGGGKSTTFKNEVKGSRCVDHSQYQRNHETTLGSTNIKGGAGHRVCRHGTEGEKQRLSVAYDWQPRDVLRIGAIVLSDGDR